MVKLTPTDWRTLVKIFEADGFTQDRTTGSHVILSKPGVLRPVIIPRYAEIGLDIIPEQHAYRRDVTDPVFQSAQENLNPRQLVHADGSTAPLEFDRKATRALYREAYAQAKAAGFGFRSLVLNPQDKLVEIVRRSRQLALEGQGGEGGSEDESPA